MKKPQDEVEKLIKDFYIFTDEDLRWGRRNLYSGEAYKISKLLSQIRKIYTDCITELRAGIEL